MNHLPPISHLHIVLRQEKRPKKTRRLGWNTSEIKVGRLPHRLQRSVEKWFELDHELVGHSDVKNSEKSFKKTGVIKNELRRVGISSNTFRKNFLRKIVKKI